MIRNTIGDLSLPSYDAWFEYDKNGGADEITWLASFMIFFNWFIWFMNLFFMFIILMNLFIAIVSIAFESVLEKTIQIKYT